MRGRKPKPSMLKALHGNPGKRARKRDEPVPVAKLSSAPAWLTAGQKAIWDYAMRHAPPGLLTTIDQSALLAWVVACDLHQQATEAQAGRPLIVKAKVKEGDPTSGYPIQSPFLAIINRQALIMLKAASELGFSPVSRPRTRVEGGAGMGTGTDDGAQGGSIDDFLATDPDRPTLQ